MPHVAPKTREELQQYEPAFQLVESFMGFVPRSLFTMGHRPELLEAFLALASTIQTTDQLAPGFVQLVAYIASTAAGCRYCQAHTAAHAALTPNASTPEHFEALRSHYTERQIVDLVAIIALYGFLNRWNDTMATELEEAPATFGASVLAPRGWEVGKHR